MTHYAYFTEGHGLGPLCQSKAALAGTVTLDTSATCSIVPTRVNCSACRTMLAERNARAAWPEKPTPRPGNRR